MMTYIGCDSYYGLWCFRECDVIQDGGEMAAIFHSSKNYYFSKSLLCILHYLHVFHDSLPTFYVRELKSQGSVSISAHLGLILVDVSKETEQS